MIDYPAEPGCQSTRDEDESDPTVLSACADGVDNDGDGLTDYPADPGCESAVDHREDNLVTGACGQGVGAIVISGTGQGETYVDNLVPGTLSSSTCGGEGAEAVFTFEVTGSAQKLHIRADYPETTLDAVMYVRSTCLDETTELACDGDGAALATRQLLLPYVPPGSYTIVVDGVDPSSVGVVKLTVEATVPDACSNQTDDDGDGLTDYPFEPGCDSPEDTDETDPSAAPACGNGSDDDGDGLTDYPSDLGCSAASDTNEVDDCVTGLPAGLVDIFGGPLTGTTTSGTGLVSGSCDSSSGPEDAHAFVLSQDLASLTFTVRDAGSYSYPLLYLYDSLCATASSELACDTGSNTADITFDPEVGKTYYLIVDSQYTSYYGGYIVDAAGTWASGAACQTGVAGFACEAGTVCDDVSTGGKVCRPLACGDGQDNDGDGRADYPNDPGCTSAADDDETTPSPAPQCGDGQDNDGDGLVDYPDDPGCADAADTGELDDCVAGLPVQTFDPLNGFVTGATASGTSHLSTCSMYGPEQVWAFTSDGSVSELHASIDHAEGFNYKAITAYEATCGLSTSKLDCNYSYSGQAKVRFDVQSGTTYYVAVDAYSSSYYGSYTMRFSGTLSAGTTCEPMSGAAFTCGSTASCQESSAGAGDWTCVAVACADGIDNDGDGKVDSADPGCYFPEDNDETDTSSTFPCSDGFDNDGDGRADYPLDPGCLSAADPDEADTCNGVAIQSYYPELLEPAGATASGTSFFSGTCDSSSGPEAVWAFIVQNNYESLRFKVNDAASFNYHSLIAYEGTCADSSRELACQYSSSSAEVTVQPDHGKIYYLVIDGGSSSYYGDYAIDVTGVVAQGGRCVPFSNDFVCVTGTSCSMAGAGDWRCTP